MRLAHRVKLGGVHLDSIDPRIIIKGVDGGAGKDTVTAVATGAGDGTRITGKRRESVEVQVRFSMNIRRDVIEERAEVLEAVNAWAVQGGWLEINYKPNRRLYVDEIVTPGEGDLWKRLSEYTITFRARAVPYWQEKDEVSVTTKTSSGTSGVIAVAGSAKTAMNAELLNMSGKKIDQATITIGGKSMSFTTLGMNADESLVIDHSITKGKNVIRIRIRNTAGSYRSVLKYRTEGSADEFLADPGDCAFSFTAQRACRLTVKCRGRFV